eukprot:gene20609-19616_t
MWPAVSPPLPPPLCGGMGSWVRARVHAVQLSLGVGTGGAAPAAGALPADTAALPGDGTSGTAVEAAEAGLAGPASGHSTQG